MYAHFSFLQIFFDIFFVFFFAIFFSHLYYIHRGRRIGATVPRALVNRGACRADMQTFASTPTFDNICQHSDICTDSRPFISICIHLRKFANIRQFANICKRADICVYSPIFASVCAYVYILRIRSYTTVSVCVHSHSFAFCVDMFCGLRVFG